MSEEAVCQAASRLRKRYRELLREEIAQTVAEPGDVDDEIRKFIRGPRQLGGWILEFGVTFFEFCFREG